MGRIIKTRPPRRVSVALLAFAVILSAGETNPAAVDDDIAESELLIRGLPYRPMGSGAGGNG